MSMQEQREVHDAILDRLNRRLRTLCQCTSTFFQAESEQELLQSLGAMLVAGGDCRLAWIGYCEDDADKTIRPVAQVGSGFEYLERVKTSWGEMEAGQGPAGMAARTGEACCVADIRTDARFSLWRGAAPAPPPASSPFVLRLAPPPRAGARGRLGARPLSSPPRPPPLVSWPA